MSKITEYLKELNLKSYKQVDSYIYDNSITTLNSLVLYLRELIDTEYTVSEYTPFTFLPNSDISGAGGCEALSCKIHRAKDFSIFTALYADKVYLKLDFITSEHYELHDIDEIEHDAEMEEGYKIKLKQDMYILIAYFELIENNIICITPARFMICPDCFQKSFLNSKSKKDVSKLKSDYVKKAKVILQAFDGHGHAEVRIDNIDEFFPDHPLYYNYDNPEVLKLLKNEKVGTEIKNKDFTTDLVNGFIENEILEASYTAIYCNEQSARLITNKLSDAMFFGISKNSNNLRIMEEKYKSLPEYLMPIVYNLDLENLINLRNEEQESFNKYRIALNKAIYENQKMNNENDSIKIYDELIYPELNNLNMKLKQLKQGSLKRTFGTISVVGSVIVANMFGDLFNPTLLTATVSFGTTVAAVGTNFILDRQSKKKANMQNNDFYFLWRLNQK